MNQKDLTNEKKIVWTLQTVLIKDLKDHPKNPRQISKNQFQHLTRLIDKFGMIDKIIVNKDMTVIGGHQRLNVLKRLKHKTCDVWVPMYRDWETDRKSTRLNSSH